MNPATNYSNLQKTDTSRYRSEDADFFLLLNTALDLAIDKADDTIAQDINWISNKFDSIITKLKNEIFTPHYIAKTSKDFIRAKVLPLSSPPGWEEAMKKANGMKKVMQGVKSERTKLLADIETQMANGSSFQKKCLDSQRSHLRQGIDEMGKNLEAVEKYIVYLNKVKQNKISARFGGYCGTLANFIIPGSGSVVGSINTGLHLVSEEKLVASLPEKFNLTLVEKQKVRSSTMSSVALSIATLAFTLYALPVLKASALEIVKGYI